MIPPPPPPIPFTTAPTMVITIPITISITSFITTNTTLATNNDITTTATIPITHHVLPYLDGEFLDFQVGGLELLLPFRLLLSFLSLQMLVISGLPRQLLGVGVLGEDVLGVASTQNLKVVIQLLRVQHLTGFYLKMKLMITGELVQDQQQKQQQ